MLNKLFVFTVCIMCGAAYGAPDQVLVGRAEKYLNSITGLSGDFVQASAGRRDKGTFSMLRPGRVRLDYDSMPVQMIADGKDLYFFDKLLDQITTVPLTSTPAGILVRKNIDLQNADIVVSDTVQGKDTFSLKMNLRGQEGLGYMTVVFNNNPVALNSWTVVDATGAKTEVAFQDMKTKTNFGKDYFQLQRHKTVGMGGGDAFYD